MVATDLDTQSNVESKALEQVRQHDGTFLAAPERGRPAGRRRRPKMRLRTISSVILIERDPAHGEVALFAPDPRGRSAARFVVPAPGRRRPIPVEACEEAM